MFWFCVVLVVRKTLPIDRWPRSSLATHNWGRSGRARLILIIRDNEFGTLSYHPQAKFIWQVEMNCPYCFSRLIVSGIIAKHSNILKNHTLFLGMTRERNILLSTILYYTIYFNLLLARISVKTFIFYMVNHNSFKRRFPSGSRLWAATFRCLAPTSSV